MIGDGIVVQFTQSAFFGADAGGKITEVVDRKRNVRGASLADGFAIVQRFGQRQKLQILLHLVGDLQQDGGADGGRGMSPRILDGVRRVERFLDVLGGGARNFGQRLPVNGTVVGEILPFDG